MYPEIKLTKAGWLQVGEPITRPAAAPPFVSADLKVVQRHLEDSDTFSSGFGCKRLLSALGLRCASRTKGPVGWLSITTCCWEAPFPIYALLLCSFTFYLLYLPTEQRIGWWKAILFHTLPQHKKQKDLVG